jgi:predicted AAA+ superfamily ATPase
MRYLDKILEQFADDKFVLLSGPRQVGKTTLAKEWLKNKNGLSLNWDIPEDREILLKPTFMKSIETEALVLDELHKYARWKSWLKGLYDKKASILKVLVTGSARLDVFQKSGDSLLGRYELLRLHPFSIGELTHGTLVPPPKDWLNLGSTEKSVHLTWQQLETRSGFPEPFFKNDELQHRRWSTRRRELLIREDLREISQIRTISLVEQLAILLPYRVGSPLSINSLREDLQVAHDTVSDWLHALERLYFCFRISPYSKKMVRSLKKEQKLYLWDWSQLEDPGARFENMVASHLLKSIHAWNDVGYGQFELKYWRNLEKREVDFVVTNNQKPLVLIECKKTDTVPSEALLRLGTMLQEVPQIQLIDNEGYDKTKGLCRVVNAASYLAALV